VHSKEQNTEIFKHSKQNNLYGQVSAEVQGHYVSVKQRSGPSVRDSIGARAAAVLEICVCQAKCWHFLFVETGI
jgi:hypothetical protein